MSLALHIINTQNCYTPPVVRFLHCPSVLGPNWRWLPSEHTEIDDSMQRSACYRYQCPNASAYRSAAGYIHPRRLLAVPSAAASSAPVIQAETPAKRRLLYDGIVFDMDGTLTEAHIDFADMRARTGIPVGDLFVAMESWDEPDRIKKSMDVILEIEAEAAKTVTAKAGLLKLLQMLKESDVKVGLVTRNTTSSVNAFFELVGDQWRELFSEIRTREFRYVKPDKRLLLDVAQAWQLHPGCLLMVGDSFEDVEVGNAAGTASCLVTGGGNEAPGSNMGPPPGAIPTISVDSLTQLQDFLVDTAPVTSAEGLGVDTNCQSNSGSEANSPAGSLGVASSSSLGLLGWSLRSVSESESESDGEGLGLLYLDPTAPGSPAPGLDFVDFLIQQGAISTASCSFPRMGAAAGGLQACPQGGGDTVLHVGCGDGALTKMLASKGLCVVGADADVSAGIKRGLRCAQYQGAPLSSGSLAPAAAVAGAVDAVLLYTGAAAGHGVSSEDCFSLAALQEYKQVLKSGGRLCVEVPYTLGTTADEIRECLAAAGYSVVALQLLPAAGDCCRVRLVAGLQ